MPIAIYEINQFSESNVYSDLTIELYSTHIYT